MRRKRLTQIFPWLLPVRKCQRLFCFYTKMQLNGIRYSSERSETVLPFLLFETSCHMYNKETGFDMVYQENKVFNLKLAANTLDKIVIRPNETFSFWKLVRYADKRIPYKDGLIVSDGMLKTCPGGGLCQISNLLFWLFLHTPLTIVERHGHAVKDFPDPPSDAPIGVDATISEGWLDLKVINNTDYTIQIAISFDEVNIMGQIRTDIDTGLKFEVINGAIKYCRKNGKVFEDVDVIQNIFSTASGESISTKLLYRNHCEIGYQLSDDTEVETIQ